MDALEVLKKGMKLEKEGREFYLKAAEKSEVSKTAEVFRSLAEDEKDHYNYVARQYDALEAGKDWIALPNLESIEPADIEAPIFPKGVEALEKVSSDFSDREALLFALDVESKSFKLYHGSAQAVENPEAKKLFYNLAVAETKHFDLLMSRYEAQFGYGK